MAAVVPTVMDRIQSILEGQSSGVTRYIPTRRFQHVPHGLDITVQMASQRPRPFLLTEISGVQPQSAPVTGSGDQIWAGSVVVLSIAYAIEKHGLYDQSKEISEDVYQIRRALGYQPNFTSVVGCTMIKLGDHKIGEIATAGETIIRTVEIEISISVRENQS